MTIRIIIITILPPVKASHLHLLQPPNDPSKHNHQAKSPHEAANSKANSQIRRTSNAKKNAANAPSPNNKPTSGIYYSATQWPKHWRLDNRNSDAKTVMAKICISSLLVGQRAWEGKDMGVMVTEEDMGTIRTSSTDARTRIRM